MMPVWKGAAAAKVPSKTHATFFQTLFDYTMTYPWVWGIFGLCQKNQKSAYITSKDLKKTVF